MENKVVKFDLFFGTKKAFVNNYKGFFYFKYLVVTQAW
jgi:hypothetical protein